MKAGVHKMRKNKHTPGAVITIAFFTVLFIFSFMLMFHTFSYDARTYSFEIAFKLWSDFSAHIPLIRSFSMGDNFSRFIHGTVQYPIFPGEPIRYHFLFFMMVGLLEKLGLRIDWALNLPSALGFFAMLVTLFLLAKRLTRSTVVGYLTVLFTLFNGSLAFLRFFTLYPLSSHTIRDIIEVKYFPAFAPWGVGEITAFWNLNIFTNQRHLAVAFALIFAFIFYVVDEKRSSFRTQILYGTIWGLIFGIFPYFHLPSLLILAVCMLCYVVTFPGKRLFLIVAGCVTALVAVPQVLLLSGEVKSVVWYPGYIIHNELLAQRQIPLMVWHMVTFWWQNLGLHSALILVGFFLIPKTAKKALFPIIPIFIIPNLFKFSIEASANHKFFNFVMMLGSVISAYMLVRAWILASSKQIILFLRLLMYLFVCIWLIVLTLSGIIDFFVIANDTKGKVADIPQNEMAAWIVSRTPPSAIFLNSSYLYHPASIAGRAVFLGWPYFPWSAGYKENRMPIMDEMYEARTESARCNLLTRYNISYITVENVINDKNLPNIDLSYFLTNYQPAFLSHDKRYAIFTTRSLCPNY